MQELSTRFYRPGWEGVNVTSADVPLVRAQSLSHTWLQEELGNKVLGRHSCQL